MGIAIPKRPQPTAYYTSVAAEVAVCRKHVGLAVRSDLDTLELRGEEPALERLLGARAPAVGWAENVAGTWCARTEPAGVILLGRPSSIARWERLAREAIQGGSRIEPANGASARLALSLVGPHAGKLLAHAGLPDDLPVGSVSSWTLAGCPATLLPEDTERQLLLVPADCAAAACDALFTAGRDLHLSLVGVDALARLSAARKH